MPKALDITNQRFGNLIAIEKAPSQKGKTYWKCKCDCGNEKIIQTSHLIDGRTKSCGCSRNKTIHPVVDFRKKIKIALVEGFQHKCMCCGLEDEPVLYDFHHLIPEEKSFSIANSSTTRSREVYANEAKKCIMVCSNCHRRIENKLIDLKDYELIQFDEKKYWDVLHKLTYNV